MAALVALAAAAAGSVLAAQGRVSWPAAVGGAVALGAVAYGAAVRVLRPRLEAVAAALASFHPGAPLPPPPPSAASGDELDALGQQVRRTGQALQTEVAELRRLEHYRREFLGNVSHELKTPVFAIQGFAETLLDGALEDEKVRRAFTEKILRNTARLHTLTRDLTEIARIESGELHMSPAPFRLDRLVAEVMETLQPLAHARGVAVASDAPETLAPVVGDRERLRQVVTNLVGNAIAYNRPGGRVDVRLSEAGGRVRCSVEDTGVGIAPEHLPRLTERFYRVDRSRSREQGGTGLGLSIVKHLLAAHDAPLHIESTVGIGSRFAFDLPAARPQRG